MRHELNFEIYFLKVAFSDMCTHTQGLPVRVLGRDAEDDTSEQREEDAGDHEDDGSEAQTPLQAQGEPDGNPARVHQNGTLVPGSVVAL